MCTWNWTWFFKVDWNFLNFLKMCQNQKPNDLKIWRTRFKLAPSSRGKKLLSKSRSKVLFKKKNKPTLVQINVEFLWENKRNPCWLSSWVCTHLTNIKGENEGGRGCFLSRNTEQDQPFKKIGVMYSENDGNAWLDANLIQVDDQNTICVMDLEFKRRGDTTRSL